MSKPIVKVYLGGRGSGKTLSMSAAGGRALLRGRPVWSNYPISVKYKDPAGEIHTYRSQLIDISDLLEIQQRDVIRGTAQKPGLVLLDEWNLFMNSRRSVNLASTIFSGVVQLIRKRHLSFYITTQDFMTLDKNIRWQCDITVSCFDLSYRYSNIKPGYVISQRMTDWTGVHTGRSISEKGDYHELIRNTRNRLFVKASNYHGSYDTGFEYDVLSALTTKFSFSRNSIHIGNGEEDNGGFDMSLLADIKERCIYDGKTTFTVDEIQSVLRENGLDYKTLKGQMGKKLKESGFLSKKTSKGTIYNIAQ